VITLLVDTPLIINKSHILLDEFKFGGQLSNNVDPVFWEITA